MECPNKFALKLEFLSFSEDISIILTRYVSSINEPNFFQSSRYPFSAYNNFQKKKKDSIFLYLKKS